jgi:hypothetical protein
MQAIQGEILGTVGTNPAPIAILFGIGAPSAQVIDPASTNVQNVALGSLYIDTQAPALYFKTSVASAANPNGGWTQVTIP